MPPNTDKIGADYEELKDAWQLFVEKGIITPDVLRPEIADSWQRSYKDKNLEFYPDPLPAEKVKVKQEKNSQIINVARPIMQDIYEMMKLISDHYAVALFDSEGDIIEILNHHSDLIKLGHRCSEIHGGTGAPGLALTEGHLVEVTGYEHLFPQAHNWHTVGMTIHSIWQTVAGVLGVINLEGRNLAVKPMVSLGAKLIEAGISRDQMANYNMPVFLDTFTHMGLCTDEQGAILSANDQFCSYTGVAVNVLKYQPLSKYISGDIDYSALVSASDMEGEFNRIKIIPASGMLSPKEQLFAVNKIVLRDYGRPLIVIWFQDLNAAKPGKITTLDKSQMVSEMTFAKLIGQSPVFEDVKKVALRAAHSVFNILILGESGTGKEMIAQAIHNESRPGAPFIAVNCGAIPKELLLSELFGYEEGAFTGAKKGGNTGKIQLADKGTLFLDEIGEMPLEMQVVLLRFLQDKVVTPVGGSNSRKVDVRIIAATNRNLYNEMKNSNFREDLYYRLNVIQINMPPLAERRDDIPLLVDSMLKNMAQQFKLGSIEIDPEAIGKLCAYHWPGNVRELLNVLESALVYADNNHITVECLPPYLRENQAVNKSMEGKGNLKKLEKNTIIAVMQKHGGNISKAAQELGITRATLYSKINKFGIKT